MDIQKFIENVELLQSNLLQQAKHYLSSADDAEDAVQETLVKLWLIREKIADTTKFRNLASVICKNASLNILRNRKNAASIEQIDRISSSRNPHEQLEEQENKDILRQSIQSLPIKQRAILKMRNVDNMTYAEIAKVIGTTESSVRGMISKARMELITKIKGSAL